MSVKVFREERYKWFSKQGFRGEELMQLTEYATMLGNVSDLSLEKSMSSLTSAVKSFNLESSESLHVVNALNEIDNNFAISYSRLCWQQYSKNSVNAIA